MAMRQLQALPGHLSAIISARLNNTTVPTLRSISQCINASTGRGFASAAEESAEDDEKITCNVNPYHTHHVEGPSTEVEVRSQ